MCKIIVIIPVYNAEKYVEEAVLSVLNQAVNDIEVVLVNDGSTDGSPRICNLLAEKYPNVFACHQENGGVSAARNKGIEFALSRHPSSTGTAQYIAFLDADDFWCGDVLNEKTVAEIAATNADIVGFSTYVSNLQTTCFAVSNQYEKKKTSLPARGRSALLLAGPFAAHFYHLDLFRENPLRFMDGISANEDAIFSRQAVFCSREVQFIDRFLYVYRTNPASATHSTRYGLHNATYISDAWYKASGWAFGIGSVSREAKNDWETTCRKTAAMVLLEMARILAESGCSSSKIDDCIRGCASYVDISSLRVEELALWQQNDLIRFREDFRAFCLRCRAAGTVKKLVRCALRIPFLKKLYDKKKFPIKGLPQNGKGNGL